MASPRETCLDPAFAPNAPYFARKVNSGTASLTKFDGVEAQFDDITRHPTNDSPAAGVAVSMDVPVTLRRCRVELNAVAVTVLAANDYASVKLCDLPDRNIAIFQCEFVGSVVFSGDYATNDDPTIGIGTAAASNSTLSTTMQDILNKITFTNITAGASNAIAGSFQGATGALTAARLVADAAGNALYLNVGNEADLLSADGVATFTGYVDFWYVDLGNVGS